MVQKEKQNWKEKRKEEQYMSPDESKDGRPWQVYAGKDVRRAENDNK